MASVTSPPPSSDTPDRRAQITARTLRTDRWWIQPAITATVLVLFVIYSTIRAFSGSNYYVVAADLAVLLPVPVDRLR